MPQDRIWERYDVIDNDYFIGRSRDILDKVAGHRKRFALPERYFVSVGRFSEEKNLTRLLQAYRRYRDAEPDGWDLVIVGDGPQREELLGVARSLNLDDVIWPGFVQINELPIYYALSDGFVLPSVSEPWGLVVNEAMACGLPVLVSDRCGSAPDLVVEGKNGYTFDPYSVDAIADRMLRLASLDEARRAAMRRVSSEIIADYSLEAWAENMADCLRQTVARVRSYGEKPS
jgi:glycosyltransferase involved in cell wall biosynthesis